MKFTQQAGDDIRTNSSICSHTQTPIMRTAQSLYVIQGLIYQRKYFLAIDVEFLTSLGQMRFATNLVKELYSQSTLQMANLGRDCWLTKVQFFSSADKATVFRYNLKCGQLM